VDEAGHCDDSGDVDFVEELEDIRGQAAADDVVNDPVGPVRGLALDFEVWLVGRRARTSRLKTGTYSGPATGICRASDPRRPRRTESSGACASASGGWSAFLPLADDGVDALSNDIDGLSNFLKQVTRQCSEPDPGEAPGQQLYSWDCQGIV
jgi:hypothetical protein